VEQAEDDPLGSLETDLNTWRKTSFDRLLVRRDSLPALREAAQRAGINTSKGRWQEQVRAFLVSVVAAHDRSAGTPGNTNATVNNPAVIREIFGLTPESRDASVATRLDHAGKQVGGGRSGHTLRTDLHGFADQLAIWIRAYLDEQAPGADQTEATVEDAHLISREDDLAWLRDTYRALLEKRGGVFQLWGIAGVGKTTLARRFAETIGPDRFIGFIRIGRRGLYEEDIRRVLLLEGHDVDGLSDDQCLAKFRTTVTRLNNVRLLILDDAQDCGDVSALLPQGSNVPVLVTARERISLNDPADRSQRPARHIRELPLIDTIAYLREQLPNVDDKVLTELANLSGGHPETVTHIVHYLTLGEAVPAEELIDEFSRSASTTLTGLSELAGTPEGLSVLVDRLLGQVDEESFAWAILAAIVWTNEVGVQSLDLIMEVLTEWSGTRPTSFQMNTAIAQLERLGLLAGASDALSVPRLTCLVLRDLLIGSRTSPLRAYERVLAAPSGDTDSRLIRVLRREYDAAQPMREELARDYQTDEKPLPALVCIDEHNWAFFVSLPHDGKSVRLVRLFRKAPHGILSLDPADRQWRAVSDGSADYFVGVAERYYELAKGFYMRGWSPERIEQYKKERGIDWL
jgi:hypothetical protein